MLNKIELAISFGSSNTTILLNKSGIVLNEPTLALKDGLNICYGNNAKNLIGRASTGALFVAPIEAGEITDEFNATEILKHFLGKIVPKRLFFKPYVEATFIIPCSLSEKQKTLYKNVAYGAGISVVKFAYSCICAKCGYFETSSLKDSCVVCDIGAGKTDIAIVSGQKIIAGTTLGIGGGDMDASLKDYIEKTYDLVVSKPVAEKIKTSIGSLYIGDKASIEVGGIALSDRQPKSEIISASDVLNAVGDFYIEIAKQISNLIKGASSEIASDIISNGCYFCGGASLIPGLDVVMKSKLSLPVKISGDADFINIIGDSKLM